MPVIRSGSKLGVSGEDKAEMFSEYYSRHPTMRNREAEVRVWEAFDSELNGVEVGVEVDSVIRAVRRQPVDSADTL